MSLLNVAGGAGRGWSEGQMTTQKGYQVFVNAMGGLQLSYFLPFVSETGYPLLFETEQEAQRAIEKFQPSGHWQTFVVLPVTRRLPE